MLECQVRSTFYRATDHSKQWYYSYVIFLQKKKGNEL